MFGFTSEDSTVFVAGGRGTVLGSSRRRIAKDESVRTGVVLIAPTASPASAVCTLFSRRPSSQTWLS